MNTKYKLNINHFVEDKEINLRGILEEKDCVMDQVSTYYPLEGYLTSSEGTHKVIGARKHTDGLTIRTFVYAAREKPHSDIYPLALQTNYLKGSEGESYIKIGPLDSSIVSYNKSCVNVYGELSDFFEKANDESKTLPHSKFSIEKIK